MKKALLLLFLFVPITVTLSAQSKQAGTKFVLTDRGVDVLNNTTLALNPPAGSVYDKAVYNPQSDEDIEGITYDLFKGKDRIGEAVLYDNKLTEFTVWDSHIALDNGLKVGDNILEALEQGKVKAYAVFNMIEGAIEVYFRHGRVIINVPQAETSPTASIKLQEIEDATVQSWEDGTYDMPTLELNAQDFDSGGAIYSFSLSLP